MEWVLQSKHEGLLDKTDRHGCRSYIIIQIASLDNAEKENLPPTLIALFAHEHIVVDTLVDDVFGAVPALLPLVVDWRTVSKSICFRFL
jgi:hypothetical protein